MRRWGGQPVADRLEPERDDAEPTLSRHGGTESLPAALLRLARTLVSAALAAMIAGVAVAVPLSDRLNGRPGDVYRIGLLVEWAGFVAAMVAAFALERTARPRLGMLPTGMLARLFALGLFVGAPGALFPRPAMPAMPDSLAAAVLAAALVILFFVPFLVVEAVLVGGFVLERLRGPAGERGAVAASAGLHAVFYATFGWEGVPSALAGLALGALLARVYLLFGGVAGSLALGAGAATGGAVLSVPAGLVGLPDRLPGWPVAELLAAATTVVGLRAAAHLAARVPVTPERRRFRRRGAPAVLALLFPPPTRARLRGRRAWVEPRDDAEPVDCLDLSAEAPCPSPLTRILALNWYDGPTSGVLACALCGAEYAFDLVDQSRNGDLRVFALAPLPPGSIDRVVSVLPVRLEEPWTTVWPIWQFETEEARQHADAAVDAVLRAQDPPVLVVAAHQLQTEILAARRVSGADPAWRRDWFEEMRLTRDFAVDPLD